MLLIFKHFKKLFLVILFLFIPKITKITKITILIYNIIYFVSLFKIKDYILSILQTSQTQLSDIIISKEKYHLLNESYGTNKKKRLILQYTGNKKSDYKTNFKRQEDFVKFKDTFINERYNIFRGTNDDTPYFMYIFQNEYFDKSKNFFFTLFKKYRKLRSKILLDIQENYGLLSFESIFNISILDDVKRKREAYIKNIAKNKNNINYNKYLLNGNDNTNLNNNSTNNSKFLKSKIHDIDTLYLTYLDQDIFKTEHTKNCYKNYESMYDSLTDLVGNDTDNTLYGVTCNIMKLDFNTINFIFYYVEPDLFNNAMVENYKIKTNISKQINSFEMYYDLFLEWKKGLSSSGTLPFDSVFNLESFEDFYNSIINKFNK